MNESDYVVGNLETIYADKKDEKHHIKLMKLQDKELEEYNKSKKSVKLNNSLYEMYLKRYF